MIMTYLKPMAIICCMIFGSCLVGADIVLAADSSTLSSPVLLAPNTEYGMDIGMTSSTSSWTTGIPYINKTDNEYGGGYRYESGEAEIYNVTCQIHDYIGKLA